LVLAAFGRRPGGRGRGAALLFVFVLLGGLGGRSVGSLLLLDLLLHELLLLFGLALHLLGLGLHLGRLLERDVDFVDVLDALLGLLAERVRGRAVGLGEE